MATKQRRRPKDAIGVLLVTGDNMTGEMLKHALLNGRKDLAITTLIGNSHKVIGELKSHNPQIALICQELQDDNRGGLKVLKKLRQSHPNTAVIMLLQFCKAESVVGAFREGARGVFYRTHSLKALSKCIRVVHQGQIWACNEDLEHLTAALAHGKSLDLNDAVGMPLLTRREEDVVRLVADGLKNREIAVKLNVAEHSIRNYLYKIFDKLGVSTRVELILYIFSSRNRSN